MTKISIIFNVVYSLTVVLFFLDFWTGFDIKNQATKNFVYFGLLIGTPLTLLWNILLIKSKANKIIGTLFPTIILTLILVIGPARILFCTSAWHTQSILYQHGHLNFKTIEFQMQDIGALGYNERVVEVFYLTPIFMVTNEVPNNLDKAVEWIRADKNIDELRFTTP